MTLRLHGDWHVGDEPEDVAALLLQEGADGYPVHEVRHSRCDACCGGVFGIRGSTEDPTIAERTCRACGNRRAIADSDEYWSGEHVLISACVCEEEDFSVAVGFSLYQAPNVGVRSLAVATRCLACGRVGYLAEWMARSGDLDWLDQT